jgi:hypothetical protein
VAAAFLLFAKLATWRFVLRTTQRGRVGRNSMLLHEAIPEPPRPLRRPQRLQGPLWGQLNGSETLLFTDLRSELIFLCSPDSLPIAIFRAFSSTSLLTCVVRNT